MTKCGHVSMIKHFDVDPAGSNLDRWISNPSQKIVVLRHPIERLHSAIAYFEELHKIFPPNEDFDYDLAVYYGHSIPYMSKIKDQTFRIIRFEDLSLYIDKAPHIITNTTNRKLVNFKENIYYTREDLLEEVDIYHSFLQNKTIITPEEWKELT